MGHRLAVVLAAVVLSITIGVLVGLVVHTSRSVRATDVTTPQSAAALQSSPLQTSPLQSSPLQSSPARTNAGQPAHPGSADPSSALVRRVPGAGSDHTRVGSSPTATSGAVTPGAAPSTTSIDPASTTPRGGKTSFVTAPLSSSAATSPAPATPSTNAAPSSPGPAAPGSDVPNAPCAPFGARSSTAAGVTVYCQHDQGDQSLRWRAVTDAGGCVSQTMTGIGVDGKHYACRRAANGLNYWVRVP